MSSSSGSSSSSKPRPPSGGGHKGDGVLSKISVAPATNSATAALSTSSSSSASSSSTASARVLKSRKENVIPVASSHSASPSAASTELFAAKDIDRIAKYKADRRKPIYLRNTVQENENERLDNRKKSTSRSATNTPTSSAIHSKSQSSTLHRSKAPATSSLSSAASASRRATSATGSSSTSTTSAATTTINNGSGPAAKPRPSTATGALGGGGGGSSSLPLSPLHQPQQKQQQQPRKSRDRSNVRAAKSEEKQVAPQQQQQVKLPQQQAQQPQQPIRTTRSSRLRAAALAGGVVGATVSSIGVEDVHQQRLKASSLHAAPSGGGTRKLPSPSIGANRISPTTTTTTNTGNRATALASASKQRDQSATRARLVPTITAVSMKQKLKETTETISKFADINRNSKGGLMAPNGSTNRTSNASNGNDLLNGNAPPTNPNNNPEPIAMTTTTTMTPVSGGEEAFMQRIPSTATDPARGGLTVVGGGISNGNNIPSLRRPPLLDSIVEIGSSLDSPPSPRMRTSTMKSGMRKPLLGKDLGPALSPVRSNGSGGVGASKLIERDKSAKRKSNLNRAPHEESTETRHSSTERRRLRSKSGSAPLSSPDISTAPKLASPSPPATTVNGNANATRRSPHSVEIFTSPATSPGALSSSPSLSTTTADLVPLQSESSITSIATTMATTASPVPSSLSTTPSPALSFESSVSRISPSSLAPSSASQATFVVQSSSSSSGTLAAAREEEELPRDSSSASVDVRVDSRISGAEQPQLEEEALLPDSPLPVVSQYSKFSQMLKSPTLEKHEVRVPAVVPSPLAMIEMAQEELEAELREDLPEEIEEEVPLLNVSAEPLEQPVEEEEQMLDQSQELGQQVEEQEQVLDQSQELMVPLDVVELEEEVCAHVEHFDVDFMEAGPSGLCPIALVSNGVEDGEQEDELLTDRLLLMRNVRRSRSSSPRPANRILFDDKFNDEFVVIENSPKSHFIQSLDETDIIVIGDNDEDYPPRPASSNSAGAGPSYEKKLVKMSSVEHFEHLHQRKSCSPQRKKSLSPIIRAKSMEENHLSSSISPASNHIVSILKRKTVESNSSASSNASPVTFSPSVVDTPIRSNRRQGILKKRCSLDESRYSRSHSPDDRSILVKHTRRNSFEDGTQHGILKQKSYESKEDVSTAGGGGGSGSSTAVNSVVSHGILKKKTDSSSTSTPNEQPKHVSISQAVILAAAEICQDMLLDHEHDHEIRPILKSDSQPLPTPKPILKKKYSSESEEIRPILKSSRKSSREENSDSEELKRSILKTDSPAKRRSFGDRDPDPNGSLIRSRSLEQPDPVQAAPIIPQVQNIEKPIISVAERIKNMEKFLSSPTTNGNAGTSGGNTSNTSAGSSSGAVPKRSGGACASSRRETFRFKTQPVTSSEISGVQQQQVDHRSGDNPEESFPCEEPTSYLQTEEEAVVYGGTTVESLCRRGSLESLICKEKLHSEDKSLELLSPTFPHTESNSHSFSGEFNLASLSSDSGIQFGRGTEETSGADYVSSVKTSDSDKSPSKKTIDDDLNELDEEEDEEHLQIIEETEGQRRLLLSPSSAAAAAAVQDRRRPSDGSSSCSSSSDLSDREVERMYTAATTTVSGNQQPTTDDDQSSSGLRRSNSVRARASMFQQMESRLKENESPAALPRGRRVMPTGAAPTQFATQTISPTDIERNIHNNNNNANPSNLINSSSSNLNNNNNSISDDSGTEFDPSTLQVSKKIKLFSGGGDQILGGGGGGGVATATITTPTGAGGGAVGAQVPKKKFKFRTIGKLIMPKFLNDNNNNISNSATNTPPAAEAMAAPPATTTPVLVNGDCEGKKEDGNLLNCSKVERIRRKFMGDSSTPIIDDEECDSNVESGKENNYDSGAEIHANVRGITALKRNFLNGNRSHNKSILLNSSMEVEEVVVKGKVSNMAKQWNRMRANTLDVSVIKKLSNTPQQPDPANVTCDSLPPYETDTKQYSTNNSSLLGRTSSFKTNSCKGIENRFAHYFGLQCQSSQNPVATVLPNNSQQNSTSPINSKARHRSRSMSRGNPPAPPPQRPVDDRIAKYFGINKSFSGCGSPRTTSSNKPRAIVKPQQRLLDPASSERIGIGHRRRSRSMPRESAGSSDELDKLLQLDPDQKGGHVASVSFCVASGMSGGKMAPLKHFEELNITAEDLSMADSEFDKIFLE